MTRVRCIGGGGCGEEEEEEEEVEPYSWKDAADDVVALPPPAEAS